MEELQIALQARGLTVSKLPEKGRCLFATRDFNLGEVIISQEPYVCVANNSSSSDFSFERANTSSCISRCDGCFTSINLKKCSACQVVWYCGSNCQKLDWKLHRLECQVLSRLDKEKRKSVSPTLRLMLRLYIRRKLQNENLIPSTATDNYYLVEELVAHMSDIDEKQLELYTQMAKLINLILQWPEINIKEIAENFSKLDCNTITIFDNGVRFFGTGLYPVISIINHSCLPNAIVVFEGRLAVLRAVQHIPKGAEVLISYIETAGTTMTRQKALKEQYFFTCTCPRCIQVGQYDDLQESAILEGYRCKDDGCSGFLLCDSDKGFTCQQCGLLRSKDEIKKIAKETKALSNKILASTSCGNNQGVVSTYKMIEKLQRKLYHPLSIILIETRQKLVKALMELEDWKEALAYCRLTIPVYQRVYPQFHPVPGLQYYTCGKIEWFLGETENAIKSLTKALEIFRIPYGTNSPFMKEVIMQLEEAQAEASHKLSSKKMSN